MGKARRILAVFLSTLMLSGSVNVLGAETGFSDGETAAYNVTALQNIENTAAADEWTEEEIINASAASEEKESDEYEAITEVEENDAETEEPNISEAAIAEADADVDEQQELDAVESFFDDGTANEFFDTGSVEATETEAVTSTTDDAPYTSVESLPAGTYEKVTANVYVPGSLNKVLGVNAYMTNPDNPFGIGGGDVGTPTEPVYNNATLTVGEDGKITLTVDIVNVVFQLLQVNDGTNIHVLEAPHEGKDNNAYPPAQAYDGRITKLVLQLDDFSGLYTLSDCVEFGAVLYDADNPDKDVKWYVPINVAVDFEELLQEGEVTEKILINEEESFGVKLRGTDVENAQLSIQRITEGEAYEQAKEILKQSCSNEEQPDFIYYHFAITDGEKEIELSKRTTMQVFLGRNLEDGENTYWCYPQLYKIVDGKLVKNYTYLLDGGTSAFASYGEQWSLVNLINGVATGDIILVAGNVTAVKCDPKVVTDTTTGITGIYYSNNKYYSGTIPNDDNQKLQNSCVMRSSINDEGDNSEAVLEKIRANKYMNFSNPVIDTTYRCGFYDIVDKKYYSHNDGYTYVDFILPVENAEKTDTYALYIVDYNFKKNTIRRVEKTAFEVVDDSHIKVRTESSYLNMTLFNGIIDSEYRQNKYYDYFVIVREGNIEKPTAVSDSLVYNGTEQVGVSEGIGYTLTDAKATDAGEYTAIATLKEGYQWSDGTTEPVKISWKISKKTVAKPTAAVGLTYNGTVQTGVAAGEGYTISGDASAMDAGDYQAAAELDSNYQWSDGTLDKLEFTWSIAKKAIEKPEVTTRFRYNGQKQTAVAAGEGYTISGDAEATRSGHYQAEVILDKNYIWADGTSDNISVSWVIVAPAPVTTATPTPTPTSAPEPTSTPEPTTTPVPTTSPSEPSGKKIAIPPAAENLVYNGTEQSGVQEGEGYILSGIYKATDAGTYVAIAALKDGYVWKDGETVSKNITWSIGKADQQLTAKVTYKAYRQTTLAKKAKSFKIGASAAGPLTYEVTKTPEDAAKYISVNANGKVKLKKNAKAGTYVVTVTAGETVNYKEASLEVEIVVKKPQTITVEKAKASYKASRLKKKSASFKIGAKAEGTLTYTVTKTPSAKAAKYIKVSKQGKVTLKKGAPKGTYVVTVKAAATSTYASAKKYIKIKVR